MNQHIKTLLQPQNTSSTFSPKFSLLQRKCACGGLPGVDGECAKCRSKRLSSPSRAFNAVEPPTALSVVHDVVHSPGQPLDSATRAAMEPRFGHDFSTVRIHADEKAGKSAQMVGALAYTVGRDIVFGLGHYDPHSPEGRSLLAHELTHVAQQANTNTSHQRADTLLVSEPDDTFEVEAETQAARVMSEGKAQSIEGQVHGNLLQRQNVPPKGVKLPEGMTSLPKGVIVTNAQPTHNWEAIRKQAERRCGVVSEQSALVHRGTKSSMIKQVPYTST